MRQKILAAIAQYPEVFGLRGFPGRKFKLDAQASYFNDNDVLVLYVYTADGLAFSKGTQAELDSQIVRL